MTYYVANVSGQLDQGDILQPVPISNYLPWFDGPNKTLPVIVMTPTCDLSQERAEYHRLCVLQPLPLFLYLVGETIGLQQDHWNGKSPLGKGKSDALRGKLANTIRNAWPRFHFLPSENGIFETNYVIDFELLLTVPLSELSAEQRHARLNSPYKQEIIQRLASHLMRIGTPDFTSSYVEMTIEACIKSSQLRIAA